MGFATPTPGPSTMPFDEIDLQYALGMQRWVRHVHDTLTARQEVVDKTTRVKPVKHYGPLVSSNQRKKW